MHVNGSWHFITGFGTFVLNWDACGNSLAARCYCGTVAEIGLLVDVAALLRPFQDRRPTEERTHVQYSLKIAQPATFIFCHFHYYIDIAKLN